jgi:hypothetical protein
MLLQQGDVLIQAVSEIPAGAVRQSGAVVLAEGETTAKEKILPCGCHKVDSLGNVFSMLEQYSEKGKQGVQTRVSGTWVKLQCVKTQSGYYQVSIHGKSERVNRLVAMAFIKNDNPLHKEVHHIDGNRVNNNVVNLEWGTPLTNAKDRIRHGNNAEGSKNGNSKINDIIAKKIFNSIESLNKTAKIFGVSKRSVLFIKQKKTWKHIHVEKNDLSEIVLAHGESGHKHCISYPHTENCVLSKMADRIFLEVFSETPLTHEEHGTIQLPPGRYEVRKVKEYDHFAEEAREVRD